MQVARTMNAVSGMLGSFNFIASYPAESRALFVILGVQVFKRDGCGRDAWPNAVVPIDAPFSAKATPAASIVAAIRSIFDPLIGFSRQKSASYFAESPQGAVDVAIGTVLVPSTLCVMSWICLESRQGGSDAEVGITAVGLLSRSIRCTSFFTRELGSVA